MQVAAQENGPRTENRADSALRWDLNACNKTCPFPVSPLTQKLSLRPAKVPDWGHWMLAWKRPEMN